MRSAAQQNIIITGKWGEWWSESIVTSCRVGSGHTLVLWEPFPFHGSQLQTCVVCSFIAEGAGRMWTNPNRTLLPAVLALLAGLIDNMDSYQGVTQTNHLSQIICILYSFYFVSLAWLRWADSSCTLLSSLFIVRIMAKRCAEDECLQNHMPLWEGY